MWRASRREVRKTGCDISGLRLCALTPRITLRRKRAPAAASHVHADVGRDTRTGSIDLKLLLQKPIVHELPLRNNTLRSANGVWVAAWSVQDELLPPCSASNCRW